MRRLLLILLACAALWWPDAPLAQEPFIEGLRNGAASSDRVVIASNASVDNLTPWSAGGWFQMDTFANTLPRVFDKNATGALGKRLIWNTSTGQWNCVQTRAGGSASSTTATGTYVLGMPQFVVATYADADVIRIYTGSLVKPPAEPASYTAQVNTGTTIDDEATFSLVLMNRITGGTDRALVGKGWTFGMFNAQLTQEQITRWWATGLPPIGGARVWITSMGGNGFRGNVQDWSGFANHGVITGGVSSGVRLGPMPTRPGGF